MKINFNIFTIFVIFLIFATKLVHGQGVIIAQHSGYNNPTTEGFSAGFGPGNGVQVGPVTNDLGMNAWSTAVGATAVGYYDFFPSVAGLDWELTGILRIVTPNTANTTFSLWINTGTEGFTLFFGSQANGDPTLRVQGASLSPVFILNGAGSTYNTYQLLYDAPSDTASLWVNGVEQLGDIYGNNDTLSAEVFWGLGDQRDPGTANWNLVSFETIPEPSSAALILLGSGALIYVRTRNRGQSKQASLD